MADTFELSLFLNLNQNAGPALFVSATDSSQASGLIFTAGQSGPLRITCLNFDPKGTPQQTNADLGPGLLITTTAADDSESGDYGAALFGDGGFVREVAEDGAVSYLGSFNLNREAVLGLVADQKQVAIAFDIILSAAGGVNRTWRISAILRARIFDGGALPDPEEDVYPPLSNLPAVLRLLPDQRTVELVEDFLVTLGSIGSQETVVRVQVDGDFDVNLAIPPDGAIEGDKVIFIIPVPAVAVERAVRIYDADDSGTPLSLSNLPADTAGRLYVVTQRFDGAWVLNFESFSG